MKEEALEIAKVLNQDTTFKASNGWLDAFKKRHGIQQMTVSGECGDVCEDTVIGWHDKLKSIIVGYEPQDIWNTDETGCFYRALPDKSLSDKSKQCRGGKKAKERLTICFFVNAAGGREPPMIIGKATNPRCFKGLHDKKNPHGLPYYSNKKAWMNMDVMNDVVAKLNKKMVREKRKIILFMDNVSSHSPDLKDLFSNVKVIFLPVNTTSRLQPLDAGIIKNFKVHYRRQLLTYTLAKVNNINTNETASSICKSVHVLMAIRWIKIAWEAVNETTIINCFRHCGVATPTTEEQDDPFADLDCDMECLEELVTQIDSGVTAEQYLIDEENLSTNFTFDETDGNWRQCLRSAAITDLPQSKRPGLDSSGSEEEDEEEDEDDHTTTIQSYDEAMVTANDLLLFLTEKGHVRD